MTFGPDDLDAGALRPHERLALHDERRSAVGLGASVAIVAFIAIGVASGLVALLASGDDQGIDATLPLTAAGAAIVCYLAAAATGIRWMAWVWVAVVTLIILAAELVGVPQLVALVLTGAVLVAIGLARRHDETLRQTIIALVYLAVGTLALLIDPRLGLALAGVAFTAHAAWDVVHVRRDAVVSRSLALWCIGFDITVGVGCLVVALTA
jgi:hypothetical protein